MRKILVLVPFPMTAEELANRQAQSKAVKLSPDIEIDYRPVRAAPRTYTSQQDYVLADMSLLEAGRSAQEDGYGAVCIDTVSDSGVSALRSVLDIPVIGPGRTMYTTALMLGDRFSMLSMWEDWFGLYKKVLTEMNLMHKVASMRAIDVTPDNRNLLGGKEERDLPAPARCRQAMHRRGRRRRDLPGLDHHASVRRVPGSENLPVPVINPGPLSYKTAEAMMSLDLAQSR